MPPKFDVDQEAMENRQSKPLRSLGTTFGVLTVISALALILAWMQNVSFSLPGGAWWYLPCAALPALAALFTTMDPILLKPQPGIAFVYRHYWWQNPRRDWMLHWAMWPAVVVTIFTAADGLTWLLYAHNAPFSWSGGLALLVISGFSSLLGFVLLFSCEDLRVSDEGLFFGKTSLIEWANITRVIDAGPFLEIFDKRAPKLPHYITAAEATPERTLLDKRFAAHSLIPNAAAPTSRAIAILEVVFGGAVILAAALFALVQLHFDGRLVILLTWIASMAFQALSEFARGTNQTTRTGVSNPNRGHPA